MSNDKTIAINPGDAETAALPLAIVSDIHANLPALEAVLADIESQGITRIICLGDVVGYGPDPVECWRRIRAVADIIIMGNHDMALVTREMPRFHPRAKQAIDWTTNRILEESDGQDILKAISSLPLSESEADRLYVHGSPAGGTMDYLLPADVFDRQRMIREFKEVKHLAFNGHSHIPGVIEKGAAFMPPESLADRVYFLTKDKAIINVGSVGQPRDGDNRSCYVTVWDDRIQYHRVRYPADVTCEKILSIPELDPFLGKRLMVGR